MAEQTQREQTQQKPRQYEGMFLVTPAASQDQQAAINLIRGIIERHGGEILVIKRWDERKLAYEIKKQKRGTYIIAYFRALGTVVTPIERDVKLNEDVLRVMITDASHMNQQEMEAVEPQPIVRDERPSWERGFGGGGGGYGGGGGGGGGGYGGDRGPREDRPRDDRPPREGSAPRGPRRDEPAPAEAGANKD